jgi:hypothetical protein
VVVCGGHRDVFCWPESPIAHHFFPRFTSRFISIGLLGSLFQQVSKKSNRRDPGINFNQLVDETFTEAWERYHGLMTDLPTAGMKDWQFTQGFDCGLSQEAKEHIDNLARGTIFMLNAEEARALFEKLSASKRERSMV